jgi:hypothetical protein
MTAVSVSGARRSAAVLALSAISIAIIWSVADQMATVCPAIYPAPAECVGGVRQPIAGLMTVVISVLTLGLLLVAAIRRFHLDAWPISVLGILLAAAVAIGPLIVVLRAGFFVDTTLLLIVIVSLGAGAAVVFLTRGARTRPEQISP